MQRVAVVIHVLTIILPGAAEGIAVIIRVDAPIFYQRERVLLHHLLQLLLVLIVQRNIIGREQHIVAETDVEFILSIAVHGYLHWVHHQILQRREAHGFVGDELFETLLG